MYSLTEEKLDSISHAKTSFFDKTVNYSLGDFSKNGVKKIKSSILCLYVRLYVMWLYSKNEHRSLLSFLVKLKPHPLNNHLPSLLITAQLVLERLAPKN